MKIEIRRLDVWGNADDGYEINDVYGVQATIEVSDNATDAEILKALVDQDVLYPGEYSFDDMSDDGVYGNVCDAKTDRPIVELREVSSEE